MNCLITKQGKVIECTHGIPHDILCKRIFGFNLRTFLLKRNGCRVMISYKPETIAIEYHSKPSTAQLMAIDKILAANNYYTVILATEIIEKFKPIRYI